MVIHVHYHHAHAHAQCRTTRAIATAPALGLCTKIMAPWPHNISDCNCNNMPLILAYTYGYICSCVRGHAQDTLGHGLPGAMHSHASTTTTATAATPLPPPPTCRATACLWRVTSGVITSEVRACFTVPQLPMHITSSITGKQRLDPVSPQRPCSTRRCSARWMHPWYQRRWRSPWA